jgi:hypothetical protein
MARTPYFGAIQYLNPLFWVPLWLAGPSGQIGEGTWTLSFSIPTQLDGLTFYAQAGLTDPVGPHGVSRTNPLALTFGH